MLKNILNILYNELQIFLKDRGALLIMVGAVIAYSFCYALPYYNEIIKEVPMAVVDMDNSKLSQSFIRDTNATDVIDITERAFSMEEAEKDFYSGKIKAFMVIPKDFERDILRGKQANISLYADSAYLIIYKNVYSAVLQTAISTGGKIEVAKMMKSGIPRGQALAIKQPFEFIQIPLFNSIGGYKSYVYPVILIMILHQTMLFGLGLMQGTRNEKKEKYCEDSKDIPFNLFIRSSLYVILYLIYGVAAFLIFPSIFVYPAYYNIVPLFIIYALMLYSAAFFAQTLSYCFRIREAVLMTMVVASIIFVFIPGLIWPREAMPMFINLLSFFIPATCGVDAIIKLNQNGAVFNNVFYDFLWLIFLNIFYFTTAVVLTKKSDSKKDAKN